MISLDLKIFTFVLTEITHYEKIYHEEGVVDKIRKNYTQI